jgi:hypothetical protein
VIGLRGAQRSASKAAASIVEVQAAVESSKVAATQAREQVKLAELRLVQAKNGGSGGGGGGSSGGVSPAPAPAPASPSPAPAAPSPGASPGASPSPGSPSPSPGAAPSPGAGASPSPAPVPSGGSPSVGSSGGGGGSIAQLEVSLKLARADYDQAVASIAPTKKANEATIRAADAQVTIALAQRQELSKPAEVSSLRAAVAAARNSKVQAQSTLARLQATTGVIVPANEVLFFSSLPLRVDESKLSAGDALTGVFMSVATQRVAVDASVDPSDATSLKKGQKADIEVTDLGLKIAGTITKVASTTGTDGADASRIYVEVSPVEGAVGAAGAPAADDSAATTVAGPDGGNRVPTLAELNGISVKITIPISTTSGKVLAVPTAAVSAAADGTTRVEVEDDPAKPTRFVTVTAGLRAEGFVQITPTKGAVIQEGDLVLTGTKGGDALTGTINQNDKSGSGPDSLPPVGGGSDGSDGSGGAGGSDAPTSDPVPDSTPTPAPADSKPVTS